MNVQDLLLGRTCWSCWHSEFFKRHPDNDVPVIWCKKLKKMCWMNEPGCKFWNDEDSTYPRSTTTA